MEDKTRDPLLPFFKERARAIANYQDDRVWHAISRQWLLRAFKHHYMYNFTCLGRPIIQAPIEIVAMQEIIWQVKPDLIIETGIAHGGSLVLSASMLTLLDYCDAVTSGQVLDPDRPKRKVIGIDIEIREHNRVEIEKHPLSRRIDMIEGSSIDEKVKEKVYAFAKGRKQVMVLLDSMHTHDHVLRELEIYSPLVTKGSYLIVFDTIIEDMPDDMFPDRPWGKGNNPKTAVWEFLNNNKRFEIDKMIENKLLITVAPGGYLKCISS